MPDSFLSDYPNQPLQPTPVRSADAETNPLSGSDPNFGPDPYFNYGFEVGGDTSYAIAGEVSDPIPVPGSDPLLGSGDFISANIEGGSSNTPVERSSKAKRAKRSRKDAEEPSDWLPPGWTVTRRTRTTGATAGSVDTYYVEPTTGQRFRSKVEVKRYLETGSKNKSTSDSNATPSEKTGKDSEKPGTKKTGTKRKQKAAMSFDFENPPKEVTWTLGPGDGNWKPSIGGEEVPETTVQEWAATFELVTKME